MTQGNSDRKPRGKGPKRPRKPKVDPFSIGELEITDYKDVKMLRRFVSAAKLSSERRLWKSMGSALSPSSTRTRR